MKYALPKLAVVISTGYAFFWLAHWPLGFTFFTQLSNLYAALIVLAVLKYTASVSIFVTFLIYLTILAPLMPGGIMAAYTQDHWASLCLHVITPAAGIIDFFLNDAPEGRWRKVHIALALIPPVMWLAFILVLGAVGILWHGMAAPYPFLNYLAPAGWFGWQPSTAGAATMGVGVFYAILAMIALFGLVGGIIFVIAQRISVTDHRLSRWFDFSPSRAILWFRLKAGSNKPHGTCLPLKRGSLPYPSIRSLSSCSAMYLLITSSFTLPTVST